MMMVNILQHVLVEGRGRKMENCIKIYPFDKAHNDLRALSQNGGDEDWVIVIPKDLWEFCVFNDDYVAGFGWLEIHEEHTINEYKNFVIVIASHA